MIKITNTFISSFFSLLRPEKLKFFFIFQARDSAAAQAVSVERPDELARPREIAEIPETELETSVSGARLSHCCTGECKLYSSFP